MLLTIEEIRNQLKDRNLLKVQKALAEKSINIHYETIRRVLHGKKPSYDVLVILSDYLTGGANG